MLQRIQTIWLIICLIATTLTFKLEFFSGTNQLHTTMYKVTGRETLPIVLLTCLTIALAASIIFLFKNRKLQLRLCLVGILADLLLIIHYYKEIKSYADTTTSIWSLLHAVIIICFLLAARAINKDEKLIKDSNRLR